MPLIATSRPLPFPANIPSRQGVLEFRHIPADAPVPEGVPAYVSTAVDPVTAQMIAAFPDSLRLIANFGTGTDNIDLRAARARGITVSNTPVVTEDTADLAFALILAACRKLGENERFLRDGNWDATRPMASMGLRVHGQTLGLIGFGPIAQAVARRARGFDMQIRYWNRTRRPEAEAALGAEYVASPDELVAGSDIVSLHTALVPETRHLIDAARLARFRQGAVLVNTARGPLVDEKALAEALRSGHLAAAGMDVFEAEPTVDPGLLTLPNVVLTPHIGSATAACRTDMGRRVIANLLAFLENGAALDPV
ncbi:D-glycerate dehydrogenase [Paracoccus sp. PAR01]|uniref:2-hydroxyacid dehydrogenase n=1 Tax=Paracoccus sp. PAR01 TaxID=2769282 RepID=UPI00177CB83D|nr:D-glycerate dehydrogenase [Paracoccus sp. PAR01]MBD9528337.1 D-glycerate dehydrogenase [Paracoccus sp. PAR01]